MGRLLFLSKTLSTCLQVFLPPSGQPELLRLDGGGSIIIQLDSSLDGSLNPSLY